MKNRIIVALVCSHVLGCDPPSESPKPVVVDVPPGARVVGVTATPGTVGYVTRPRTSLEAPQALTLTRCAVPDGTVCYTVIIQEH